MANRKWSEWLEVKILQQLIQQHVPALWWDGWMDGSVVSKNHTLKHTLTLIELLLDTLII